MIRTRGNFDNRRYWGIDMNEAHQIYLGTYSRIDSIDHFIKNCRMKYRCWKYWNSPMINAMSRELIVAYGMYLKVAEGYLDQKRKDDTIVEFRTFCGILSNQMIKYNPTHCKYAGVAKMRPATQNKQATRDKSKD